MTAPSSALDLSDEAINDDHADVVSRLVAGRDRVRARLVGALLGVVVLVLAAYTTAAWTITAQDAWERVNTVLGPAATTFLTLLGGSIAWYFSGQARKQ